MSTFVQNVARFVLMYLPQSLALIAWPYLFLNWKNQIITTYLPLDKNFF